MEDKLEEIIMATRKGKKMENRTKEEEGRSQRIEQKGPAIFDLISKRRGREETGAEAIFENMMNRNFSDLMKGQATESKGPIIPKYVKISNKKNT